MSCRSSIRTHHHSLACLLGTHDTQRGEREAGSAAPMHNRYARRWAYNWNAACLGRLNLAVCLIMQCDRCSRSLSFGPQHSFTHSRTHECECISIGRFDNQPRVRSSGPTGTRGRGCHSWPRPRKWVTAAAAGTLSQWFERICATLIPSVRWRTLLAPRILSTSWTMFI